MVKHVILDTDIGGDPDDAFALMFGMNSPEISIDLVVTCDEHNNHRAQFAKQFLATMGKTTPVVAGIDIGNDKYCLIEDMLLSSFGDVDTDYLDAMARTIDRTKSIEYVCIGPQSNLAALISAYPEFKDKVRVTMMGGGLERYRHGDRKAEHNIRYDVPAARAVFDSDWDKRYVLGDVTGNNSLMITSQSKIYKTIVARGQRHLDYLLASLNRFFTRSKYQGTMPHDPLTLASVFTDYVEFAERNVTMDDKGIMRAEEHGKPTIVAVDANYCGFWKIFEERILR